MRRILFDALVLFAIVGTILYVYHYYGETIVTALFGEHPSTMYVESTPIAVTIADDPHEHKQGLSGVESLGDFEGMLFVFPKEDYYGMWMRGMEFPLDMIWIDNNSRIVHIEENVTPDTYPETFVPDEPARFVLEVNAFFTDVASLSVGDEVRLPPAAVPRDLIELRK